MGDENGRVGRPRDAATMTVALDADHVREIQLSSLRRSFPFALFGSTLVACMTANVLYHSVPVAELWAWLGISLLTSVCRLAALIRYSRTLAQPNSGERWLRRMAMGNLISGMLWGGAIAYWSLTVPVEYQLFFIVVLFGLGTGVIYSNYMILPVAYAFLLPAFAPPFIVLAFEPSPMHLALVTGGIAYLVAAIAFIHRMHRTHMDALRLGYENLALLRQVQMEKEAAERSDQEKSRFLAAASHDLRQPVHAMSLFLELLVKESLSDHGRYLVNNITSATAAMGHLFDALLNISRLDAGVVQPAYRSFPLDRLLEQLCAEYSLQAQKKGLELRVRSSSAVVSTDPILIEVIVRNLISNAIEHTTQGRVLVACRKRAGQVCIEVWDTGPGIPPDEQERVFWEFHQLGNPERDRQKGLGLGLAIVRRTAYLLGHGLTLSSAPGRGTMFRLSVGLDEKHSAGKDSAAAVTASESHADPHGLGGAPLAQNLVLVIDDDAQSREGMRLLLESWGHRVICGTSGEDVLANVVHQRSRPALIISDYRLRKHETGIHVIDRVHEEYNDTGIPALLVSGDTDPVRLVESSARGIPLLHKPVQVEVLRAWVSRMLAVEDSPVVP
ncbi:ATP-binding response regulator [Dyella sp. 20L07]|uniref:ATP-binding response regulator n=1 Tax=Dyella sp. 20L07 TaxID=3384240 RepID=UPI003D27C7D3